jgi:hypothetical protein
MAICGLVSALAYIGLRFCPMQAGEMALLFLPLLGFAWLRRRNEPIVAAWGWWWVLGACGLLAWQALVNVVRPDVPPIAWTHLGNRCLMLGAAASILAAPSGASLALRLLGLSSAAAVWIYGGPHLVSLLTGRIVVFTNLGHGNAIFGNVSWVVNSAAPALIAWIVFRSIERSRERPLPLPGTIILCLLPLAALSGILVRRGFIGLELPQPAFMACAILWALGMAWWWGLGRDRWSGARCWEGWVVLAGATLLVIISIATARRGFLLFVVLAAMWLAWDRLRQTWPRVAWWGLGLATSIVLIGALAVLLGTESLRHVDRAMQARAAMEAAGSVFPWGWGGLAALQLHFSSPDNGDYIVTWMKIHDHVHNEALELLLQAGWLGLAAGAALVVWIATKAARIPDPTLRAAVVLCGLGAMVPLMTDNTVFTSLGACAIGACIGVVLKGGASVPEEAGAFGGRHTAVLTWGRLALLPVTLVAAWTGWQTFQVARLGTTITSEVPIIAGIDNAKDVYVVKTLSNLGLGAAQQSKRYDIGETIISAVKTRIGTVPWGLEPYDFTLDNSKEPRQRAQACIECLSFYPFEDRFYQILDQLRTADPSIGEEIPAALLRRLDTLYRPAAAAPVDFAKSPRSVGEAADQYVRLRALFSYGGDYTGVTDAVERLLQRYRLIPNLTKLALEGIIMLPAGPAEEIAARSLTWEMYPPPDQTMAVFLSMMVKKREPAIRVLPVIKRLYPDEAAILDRALAGENVGTVSPLVGIMLSLHGLATQPPEKP